MCQRAQVLLKPGKRSPVAHGKGPCCKNAIFPPAVREQKTSNTLCRLLLSFTCRLKPQGCHSCVLSLRKLNAWINGVAQESGVRRAGRVARRGRACGPSRPASRGRLCSLPAWRGGTCAVGASPEHPPHLPSRCPHLSIPSSFPDFSGLLPWQSLASVGSL